jgi:hypothetical protein
MTAGSAAGVLLLVAWSRVGTLWQLYLVQIGSASPPPRPVSTPNVGLAFFAMRLMARLQRMGTVPALDIDAYTAVLPTDEKLNGQSSSLGGTSRTP